MDNSRIWVTADTHFNHRNIIKYCNRPFESVEEMNEILIQNWNSCVKKNDRIIVLGDFCLAGKDKIIEIGQRLNGRKTLILGNHDSAALRTYYEAGFEMVSKYPIVHIDYNLKDKIVFDPSYDSENKFILSHEPIQKCKYFNIHGHIHNKFVHELENFEMGDYMYWNCGVDMNNFKPVLLDR